MTNEEKAREISDRRFCVYDVPCSYNTLYSECKGSALEMAEWKDKQYKEAFNVPDYRTSFEDIVNYIGNDCYANGYNAAKKIL